MHIETQSARHGMLAGQPGPGRLYNLGIAVGLFSGIALQVGASIGQNGPDLLRAVAAAADHLAGSASAVAISLAMLIFCWSGHAYRRAWENGLPGDPTMKRRGDLISGMGALMLGLGLLLTGNPMLAAAAGLLHAGGKLGSALPPTVKRAMHLPPKVFRWMVLASRGPSLLLVLLTLVGATSVDVVLVCLPLLCSYLLWLWADLILLRAGD